MPNVRITQSGNEVAGATFSSDAAAKIWLLVNFNISDYESCTIVTDPDGTVVRCYAVS